MPVGLSVTGNTLGDGVAHVTIWDLLGESVIKVTGMLVSDVGFCDGFFVVTTL